MPEGERKMISSFIELRDEPIKIYEAKKNHLNTAWIFFGLVDSFIFRELLLSESTEFQLRAQHCFLSCSYHIRGFSGA